jgi:hypothetical protein
MPKYVLLDGGPYGGCSDQWRWDQITSSHFQPKTPVLPTPRNLQPSIDLIAVPNRCASGQVEITFRPKPANPQQEPKSVKMKPVVVPRFFIQPESGILEVKFVKIR